MIPERITAHLDHHKVPYIRRPHPSAIDGQHLAAALRTTGWRVAKSVLVDMDGRYYLFVLPAPERVSLERAAELVGGTRARLADEEELQDVFPDCELGAEPPFGTLYGLDVVMEERLLAEPRMLVRAGSHQESLELATRDYYDMEQPEVGDFGIRDDVARAIAEELST